MDAERDSEVDLSAEYREPKNIIKFVVLRCVIVGILLAFAVAFHDHFIDITDFVGASAISMGCIILPIFFYLKTFWKKLPWYQRILGSVIIIVCALCGGYMTYSSGKALFTDNSGAPSFPFCPAKYNSVVFTNATYYAS